MSSLHSSHSNTGQRSEPAAPSSAAIDTRQRVAQIALEVLRSKDARNKDSRLTSTEIFDEAKRIGRDAGVEKGTFQTYLSLASADAASELVSTGRGRGGGYYISSAAATVAAEIDADITPAMVDPEPLGEAALYPVLQQWLAGQNYQARVTGSMRALGRWGNPDITGIRVTEHLNRFDLELLTIEAKLSLAQWEYWFFEAVAHRRFAHRAYFAFPLPEEAADKLPEGLRYACELYRVGALVLVLEDELYKQVKAGDAVNNLTLDDVSVQEVYSAPFNAVPLHYQRRYCEAIGIGDLNQLFRWGSGTGAA